MKEEVELLSAPKDKGATRPGVGGEATRCGMKDGEPPTALAAGAEPVDDLGEGDRMDTRSVDRELFLRETARGMDEGELAFGGEGRGRDEGGGDTGVEGGGDAGVGGDATR